MDASKVPFISSQIRPECDRCSRDMDPSAWVPRPDGEGGLRRLTIYRCRGCARLFDQHWGYRDDAARA